MSFDVFIYLFILFGVYCAFNIKKDYNDYKESKGYLDYVVYIRNLGMVAGAAFLLIWKIFGLI